MEMDWTVGEVMSARVATRRVADNTLVDFHLRQWAGESGITRRPAIQKHYAMGPARRRKTHGKAAIVCLYRRLAGRVPAGTTSAEVICHGDLMATAAAIVGVALPANAGEDSYNILPALLGKRLHGSLREATVHHSGNGSLAIRQGKWVFIDAKTGSGT